MMSRTSTVVRLCCISGVVWMVAAPSAASAAGNCTSIQAQCAVEVGGSCDPKTGKWQYAHGVDAFNACVWRKQKKR